MKSIVEKMLDRPIATFLVVGVVVDGVSVLVHNIANVVRKK